MEKATTTTRVRRAALLALTLAAASPARAQLDQRLRINGYSSFEFEKRLGDAGRADPNGSFDADLFDLVLNVTPTDRLRVAADLTWEHGAATEVARGNVAVEYAFAEYHVADWLKVRAGKMFTHFGIYNEIHTAKPAFLTVKEPSSTNRNNRFGSDLRFYPRWGNGLAFTGNGRIARKDFDYILQVTNGESDTVNPFEEDDNTTKALGGRLRFHPGARFVVGASFYADKLTELDAEGEDSGGRTRQLSYGAHAAWDLERFGVEFEYVRGKLDPSTATATVRHALTALAYLRLRDRWRPYFRYEYLDPDTRVADDEAHLLIYGVNVRVDHGLYVKAELNNQFAGRANIRFEGTDFTEFKAAVAVGF